MIEVEGKVVYSELDELIEPRHCALVLIDMQKDFMEPDFAFGRLGVDLSMYPEMRPRAAQLLSEARRASVVVVHVQMAALPGRMSDSPAQIRFNLRMHESFREDGPPLRYTVPGSEGHEFIAEMTPLDGELVVAKYRSSAFWGTNLAQLLRSNGVETIVFAGITTEGCVESTARDAMFDDFYVVVVEDCVASDDRAQHDASMLLMRHRFDMAISTEVAKLWRDLSPGDASPSTGSSIPAELGS